MTVLWDGTAAKPWGKMIFADQSVQTIWIPHPKKPPHGEIVRSVRLLKGRFQDRWFTTQELADEAGISFDMASTAIGNLCLLQEVQRERKKVGRPTNTTARQRYQFMQK